MATQHATASGLSTHATLDKHRESRLQRALTAAHIWKAAQAHNDQSGVPLPDEAAERAALTAEAAARLDQAQGGTKYEVTESDVRMLRSEMVLLAAYAAAMVEQMAALPERAAKADALPSTAPVADQQAQLDQQQRLKDVLMAVCQLLQQLERLQVREGTSACFPTCNTATVPQR